MVRGTTASDVRRAPGRPPGGGLDLSVDDLLAAAEASIERDGPDLTMVDLAAASAITKPSLYRAIGGRDALVAGLARRFGDRVNETVAAALTADDDPETQIRTIFRSYMRTVERSRNIFLFISGDSMGHDRIEQALDIAGISAVPLALTLRRAGASPADARAWSYAIVGAAQFTTFRWLRDGAPSADEVADQLSDLLWSGIDAAARRRRHHEEEEPHVQ